MILGILVPWPGIKPLPPVAEAPIPNHWTTREFPNTSLLSFWSPSAWRFPPHQQAIHRRQQGVQEPTPVWHPLSTDSIRFHRLRAQTHKTVSLLPLHVRCKPRLSPVLLTTCYRSEVPKSPPLSLIDHRTQGSTFTSSVKGVIKDADKQPDEGIRRAPPWTWAPLIPQVPPCWDPLLHFTVAPSPPRRLLLL